MVCWSGKFAYTRDFFNPTGLPMGVTQLMGRDFSGFTASGTSDDDGTAAAVKYAQPTVAFLYLITKK